MTSAFIGFAALSGLGWLIDVGLTMGVAWLGVMPFGASVIGSGAAVTFVYFTARSRVFSASTFGTRGDYGLYILWQIIAITVAALIVAALAHLLLPFTENLLSTRPEDRSAWAAASGAGKVLVTPLTLLANFAFMRWLTNRARPDSLLKTH